LEITVFILKKFVLGLLEVLVLAMLVRAVLSWFDRGEPGPVLSFVLFITEPFILPIRRLCERMHWFEGFPIDMPFMITSLCLMFLQSFLMML
jgi:uncharacterized protein YggT (Ycf19 family)